MEQQVSLAVARLSGFEDHGIILKTIAPPSPPLGLWRPLSHHTTRPRGLETCPSSARSAVTGWTPPPLWHIGTWDSGGRTPQHLHTPRARLPARNQRRYGPGTAAPTLPGRARDRRRFNICDVNQGYPSTSKRLRGVSCVELRPSTTLLSPIGQARTQDRDRPFELWPRALEGLSHSGPCRSLRSRTTKASQNNFTLASNLHRRRRPTRSRRSLWIPPSRTARPLGGRNSCPTGPRPRPPRTATPRRDRRAAPAPGTKWPIQFPLFFERRPTLPRCCFLASDRSPRLVSASFFLVVISRFVGVVAWLASLAGFALFPLDFFSRFLVVGSVACLFPTCPPERLFDRLGLKLGVVVVRTRHWTSCRPGPRQQPKLRSAANRLTPSARLVTTLLCDCARCCCAHKY